jgi:DNA-directed RNA polymerase specialized sigma24 family protein
VLEADDDLAPPDDRWLRTSLPKAVAFARSLLRERDMAEDIVHDCVCRLLARAGTYNLPRDGVKLLFRAVTNACINVARRQRKSIRLHAPSEADHDRGAEPALPDHREQSPLHQTMTAELRAAIDCAMEQLPVLWIGPAAIRPYHPTYHPGNWRAWWDFGTGSLGDLGCHILDAPFWALKLKYPTSVEGCISTYWNDLWKPCPPKNENYPRPTIARFKFPAREGLSEVKLTWWDGGMMPPRPEELQPGRRMGDSDGGVLFVGDKGLLMCGCYGRSPRLIPDARMKEYQRPAATIARIPGGEKGHEQDWVAACKGVRPASSNFDYSGPLAEMVLMGNLAGRYPDRKLLGDGEKMEVTGRLQAHRCGVFPQPIASHDHVERFLLHLFRHPWKHVTCQQPGWRRGSNYPRRSSSVRTAW